MMGPKEKKERSLGEHLHLKAARCQSPKCALVRKPYRPGAHGKTGRRPRALSDFGRQIKEKQKFKLTYGIDERNLRRIFGAASRRPGSASSHLIEALERRLDNIVFRLGLAGSRSMARQLVRHGHIAVNGTRVRAPGAEVRVGDIVRVRPESLALAHFKNLKEALTQYEAPSWLHVDPGTLEGKVLAAPDTSAVPFEANLLVEAFNK